MSNLDLATIILFSLGVLLTGVAFSRTGKDMKSFFAGGGNVPWGMNGLSLFMGFFSAGTFVVWGNYHGIKMHLISCDYVNFMPILVK